MLTRTPQISSAKITIGNTVIKTELYQNLTQIAYKNIDDRKIRYLAKAMARVSLKYGIQKGAEEKFGDFAGFLVNMFNLATEQADTRSWLTLPDNIQIARLFYTPGTYTVYVDFLNSRDYTLEKTQFDNVKLTAGKKTFLYYRTFK